ncbi:hypothetical protein N7533_013524 [Penicillium manginii]|jgi:hypothetical protein|uniref:uncharacterized protein n=1 Tax=Penicillium manginii TaxID=203109 RepID=UPI00254946EE|nr:uncharacterized protein N7533_013524 [Penicillium manginii]KAJ5733077.1 hypothetical protein N7533_013524 [Penicillium manginii]
MYNSSHVLNTLDKVARRSISPFVGGMPRIWTEVSAHFSQRDAQDATRTEGVESSYALADRGFGATMV